MAMLSKEHWPNIFESKNSEALSTNIQRFNSVGCESFL